MTSSHLNSIAEQSQLFYLEISNFSVPLPLLCKDKESDVVFHKYSERCKQELLKTNVYVQPGMLMSYLRVAKTYTMIHKYYDESEGEYVFFPVCKKHAIIQLQLGSNGHVVLLFALLKVILNTSLSTVVGIMSTLQFFSPVKIVVEFLVNLSISSRTIFMPADTRFLWDRTRVSGGIDRRDGSTGRTGNSGIWEEASCFAAVLSLAGSKGI